MTKKTTLSPKEATSYKKICSLKMDTIYTGNFRLYLEQTRVILIHQNIGEGATEINIPRKDFNRLIKFYQTKQNIK